MIKRFHGSLPTRIADSQQERRASLQQKDDFQVESANETDRSVESRFSEQTTMGKTVNDLGVEIKVMKQEITEIKARMDSIANMTLHMKETLFDGRKHYVLA